MAMGVIAQTVARVYTDAPITLTVDNITDGSIRVNTRGLQKANFRRKFEIFYKRSTASTYKRWAYHYYEAGEVPNDPIRYNVGNSSEQRLIPGKEYNFKVSITDVELSKTYVTKYITASTAAATGSFALSATPSQITATITGLKSVAYYGRCVYSYLDRGYGWELWNQSFIAAGATAPTTITHKFGPAGIYQGETHKVKVNLYTGEDKQSPGTLYRTMTAKSVVVPYADISVPKVNSISYTSPNSAMSVNWGLSLDFVDRSDETVFTFYVKRANGTVINAGSVTGWRNMSPYSLNVSSWLLGEEAVSVYIKATDPMSSASAVSPEYDITVSRLFKWDTEKLAGTEFSITASEWNRLVNYIDAAAELYPNYFTPTTDHPVVETDDQVTAVIANKVPICSTHTGTSKTTYPMAWTGLYNNGTIVRTNHRVDSATAVFAVTYNAGGSTTSKTLQTVIDGNNVNIPAGQANADISTLQNVTKCVLTVTYEYGSVHQFDTVSAALFTELVDNVNTAMHEATGL